ncbi:MAG: M48 family metalloprotease [Desulfurococcaceae archaeon]
MPLLYDPFTLLALILAYIVGFTVLALMAGYIAPRIAKRFSEKLPLYASMTIVGLLVVVSGFAGVGLTAYMISGVIGVESTTSMIIAILVIVVVLNAITYINSPLIINIMYNAKPSAQLQEVVNRVAKKLGFAKPPKAVVVRGPPNAFAYGNFIFGRYVAVSSSLVEITTPEELEAIIGHELGHHKHRDNAIMLFMGLIPSLLYFLGIMLIRTGILVGYTRSYSSSRRREGGGGLLLVLTGVVTVVVSFIVQVLVLAFSRLREYYADATGAYATTTKAMQRALARIHVYYTQRPAALETVSNSKLKALFIYAFMDTFANPFYRPALPARDPRNVDVDHVIEQLKKQKTEDVSEFFSTHPPIPKRIRFLDTLVFYYMQPP